MKKDTTKIEEGKTYRFKIALVGYSVYCGSIDNSIVVLTFFNQDTSNSYGGYLYVTLHDNYPSRGVVRYVTGKVREIIREPLQMIVLHDDENLRFLTK